MLCFYFYYGKYINNSINVHRSLCKRPQSLEGADGVKIFKIHTGVVHSYRLYFFSIRPIIQIPASNVPTVQIHVPTAKLCIFMSYTSNWLYPCCGSVDLFETPCMSSVSLWCTHQNDCTHFEVLRTFLEILCRSCVSLSRRHLNGCTHIEVLWTFLRHCVETVYNDLIYI